MRKLSLASAVLLMYATLSLAAGPAAQGSQLAIGSVGFFHPWIGDRYVDPDYKVKLNAAGYQLGKLEYAGATWEKLKSFNVLILQWAPNEGDTSANAIYDQKLPLFERFVREGGGLLVTCENAYGTYRAVNRLLSGFGAEIVNEAVVDPKHTFRQTNYLQYYFTKTGNLNRAHPLTAGLSSFTYPLTHSLSEGYGTMPLRLAGPWQAVIRGEASAKTSQGTSASEPVVVAAREEGRGRIIAMPMHTTFFFNAGFHRIWEGITMDQGGYRFLDNAFRWLAEPSLKSGTLGGFREPHPKTEQPATLPPQAIKATDIYAQLHAAGQRKPVMAIRHQKEELVDFTGLIGAHTAFSSGEGPVRDFAAKAKAKGLSFLVFAEDLALMDEAKWRKLSADCKQASDASFVAMPGLEYEDTTGNHYACFNIPRWPNREWLDSSGKKVKNTPGIYFGLDWPSLYVLAPARNPTRPWYLKFYSGMEVVSYPRGASAPVDDFQEYLQVQANDYNLIPIAGHRLYSLGDVDRACGYQTHVLAKDVASIPSCFKYFWYAQRHAYVSSGPRIHEFVVENGRGAAREEEWRLYLDVSSDAPLAEVTVYDRKDVFYRFRPGRQRFTQVLRGYHDQQRHLTMIVTDAKGRRAFSPTAYTSDLRQSLYMCTDLQNTLNWMTFLDRRGKITGCGVLGNYVTGWDSLNPGILVEEGQLMPPGLDYVVKGFGGGVSHVVYAAEGSESAVAQRDMVFASGDVNILDNFFVLRLLPGSVQAPTDYADTRARFICFTPRPSSYNLMLIETETTFKKDFTFAARQGPQLVKLRVGGPEESFPNFTYVAPDGRKVTGRRAPSGDAVAGVLTRGGYVALWPDFYGSVAVYPLREKPYAFTLQGANVEVGDEMAGRSVKAGQQVRDTFLLVRGRFGEAGDAGFERLRDLYGLHGRPAYEIHLSHGTVIEAAVAPFLKAEGCSVAGTISPADLPNDLGITVEGLNGNWDAGLYDRAARTLRRIGVGGGRGYFTADLKKRLDFVAGNLLLADHPEVRLHVLLSGDAQAEVEAHNPTEKAMTVTVQGNALLPPLAQIQKRLVLEPGELKRFNRN